MAETEEASECDHTRDIVKLIKIYIRDLDFTFYETCWEIKNHLNRWIFENVVGSETMEFVFSSEGGTWLFECKTCPGFQFFVLDTSKW